MTGWAPAGLAALLALIHGAGDAMSNDVRALSLAVTDQGAMIEVQLIGLSPHAQDVSYELEVSGPSASRHKGRTRLTAGKRAVLSTMRTSAGDDWCVRLVAEEAGREPYEITKGRCASA